MTPPQALRARYELGDSAFAALSALLMTHFGARLGVVGIYVISGRSREGVRQEDVIGHSSEVHGLIRKQPVMARTLASLAIAAMLTVLSGPLPAAADGTACLSRREQKIAIAKGRAVTLAAAMRAAHVTVRGRGAREVVKARLCRQPKGLRYLLTVLARDGKVTHLTVDAGSGKLVDAR